MTDEHTCQPGEAAFALLRREGERRTVDLDRVLVARFEAEELSELTLLHDHQLARLLDDGKHFGHGRSEWHGHVSDAHKSAQQAPGDRE